MKHFNRQMRSLSNQAPDPSLPLPAESNAASPPPASPPGFIPTPHPTSQVQSPPPVAEPPAPETTPGDINAIAEAATLDLSPSQQAAIVRLTNGDSVINAATAAGVTRMTLYRWLKSDAAFQAAYNAWQQDVIATSRARLLSLSGAAVSAIAQSLVKGDARTALTVLNRLGLLTAPKPGPTDPTDVDRRQRLIQRRNSDRLDHAEDFASLDFKDPLPDLEPPL